MNSLLVIVYLRRNRFTSPSCSHVHFLDSCIPTERGTRFRKDICTEEWLQADRRNDILHSSQGTVRLDRDLLSQGHSGSVSSIRNNPRNDYLLCVPEEQYDQSVSRLGRKSRKNGAGTVSLRNVRKDVPLILWFRRIRKREETGESSG